MIAAARWVNEHRGISLAAGAVVALAGLYWVTRIAGRRIVAYRSRWAVPTSLAAYMAADPDQFEQQTAALCRRDGCRDIHHCDQAIIVTTSGYTRDATSLARRVNIRLYDGADLARWAAGGRPPWN